MRSLIGLFVSFLAGTSAFAESQNHRLGTGLGYSQVSEGGGHHGAKFGDVYGFYQYRPDNSVNVLVRGGSSVISKLADPNREEFKRTSNHNYTMADIMATLGYRFANFVNAPVALTPFAGVGYHFSKSAYDNSVYDYGFGAKGEKILLREKAFPITSEVSHIPVIVGGQVDYKILPKLEAGLQVRYHHYTTGRENYSYFERLAQGGEAKVTGKKDIELAKALGYLAAEIPVYYQFSKNVFANASYGYTRQAPQLEKGQQLKTIEHVEFHAVKAGFGYSF